MFQDFTSPLPLHMTELTQYSHNMNVIMKKKITLNRSELQSFSLGILLLNTSSGIAREDMEGHVSLPIYLCVPGALPRLAPPNPCPSPNPPPTAPSDICDVLKIRTGKTLRNLYIPVYYSSLNRLFWTHVLVHFMFLSLFILCSDKTYL